MNNKKFLIAVLSLILLFAISCGDRPTGSDTGGSGKGDALLNSVPKATGKELTTSDAESFTGNHTYTGTLSIIAEESDFTDFYLKHFQGTGATKQEVIEYIKQEKPIEVTLTINNNLVALKDNAEKTTYLENSQLKLKEDGSYNADYSINQNNNGTSTKVNNHIEFITDNDKNNITSFKLIYAYYSERDGVDAGGVKTVYTGNSLTGN